MIRPSSPWEAECVADLRVRARGMARSTNGLEHLGLSWEDAEQTLLMSVVDACRRWADKDPDRPPAAYLHTALNRTRIKLWEKIRIRAQSKKKVIESAKAEAKATIVSLDDEVASRLSSTAITAVLKLKLSPSDYALLELRAQGRSPNDIAGLLNICDADHDSPGLVVSRRIYKARQTVLKFLRSYGITTYGDTEEVSPENLEQLFDDVLGPNHP